MDLRQTIDQAATCGACPEGGRGLGLRQRQLPAGRMLDHIARIIAAAAALHSLLATLLHKRSIGRFISRQSGNRGPGRRHRQVIKHEDGGQCGERRERNRPCGECARRRARASQKANREKRRDYMRAYRRRKAHERWASA